MGRYSVKIILTKDIPQLLPVKGKRVKLYYKGIQTLCPNCFGPHLKQMCQSERIKWLDDLTKIKKSHNKLQVELIARKNQNPEFRKEVVQPLNDTP
jgi:hypothetical protein